MKKPLYRIKQFLEREATGGIILFSAALLGLFLENSPWSKTFVEGYSSPLLTDNNALSIQNIINNVLMTLFFLLISLEIKRELLIGELNSRAKAVLPVIAAVGGMIVPACIFIIFNLSHPHNLRGWAVPVATDIAFSLAILSFLGSRVPNTLKTFLLALALMDDLGAIIIIAFFYTQHFALMGLIYSFICFFILILFNYFRIKDFFPYAMVGIFLWFCLAYAGIHVTLAGVIVGFTVPLANLRNIEHQLHPWVIYLILPLFALVNAGFPFSAFTSDSIFSTLSLGIIFGLFIGKPVGIFLSSWISTRLGFARLPKNVSWKQLLGVGVICGMGFTMSLYIETLAFPAAEVQLHLVLNFAIVVGSLLSGLLGYLILWHQASKKK